MRKTLNSGFEISPHLNLLINLATAGMRQDGCLSYRGAPHRESKAFGRVAVSLCDYINVAQENARASRLPHHKKDGRTQAMCLTVD